MEYTVKDVWMPIMHPHPGEQMDSESNLHGIQKFDISG